jgi:tetratricopeptide (TPR) repeat protein
LPFKCARRYTIIAKWFFDQNAAPTEIVVAGDIELALGKPLEDRIKNEKNGAAEVLFGLGSAVTRDGDELSSLIYLRLATWLQPDHASANVAIAETYERMKQLDSAVSAYEKVQTDSPLRV